MRRKISDDEDRFDEVGNPAPVPAKKSKIASTKSLSSSSGNSNNKSKKSNQKK